MVQRSILDKKMIDLALACNLLANGNCINISPGKKTESLEITSQFQLHTIFSSGQTEYN